MCNLICGPNIPTVTPKFILGLVCLQAEAKGSGGDSWKKAQSIYEFEALDIDGNNVSLEKYR